MNQKNDILSFNSADAVLDFAIEREQEAHDFYLDWAGKTDKEAIKEVLLEFANVEKKHKALLQNIKKGDAVAFGQHKVIDLKIGEYLTKADPTLGMTYQDSIRVAIQREMASQEMYRHLASITKDPTIKSIFQKLEMEESKHKEHFEKLYDDEFLREN